LGTLNQDFTVNCTAYKQAAYLQSLLLTVNILHRVLI